MRIAVFGKAFSEENKVYIQHLIDEFEDRNISMLIYEPFYQKIKDLVDEMFLNVN